MNNKIAYERPELTVIEFVSEDVITNSNGTETDGFITEG